MSDSIAPARQIVGIVLVRNEDLHIVRAVENAAEFCDRIILADHGSTDKTPERLRELAARFPHVEHREIRSPRESHDLIKDYAGTATWLFGVDGDEIYDPAGLKIMRERLLRGDWADSWMILGNVVNCDLLDVGNSTASGWMSPPCRSITKLYNFAHLRSWGGDTPERMHGGEMIFQPGRDASARLNLHEEIAWESSPLRCLHVCFTPRSSRDVAHPAARENIMDLRGSSLLRKAFRKVNALRGRQTESDWKKSRYMRGTRVTVDASPFLG